MCFLPICSGRQKPKISFFAGRLRSNIFRRPSGKTSSFFFFFRRRLVMVFGGQITFSTPQKCFAAPKNISRRLFPFFRRSEKPPFFFRRQKPKIGFFGGRRRSNIFRCPSGKTSAFFFFFRRRLVMVFGGQITFLTPQKYFAAPKNVSRRLFSFL